MFSPDISLKSLLIIIYNQIIFFSEPGRTQEPTYAVHKFVLVLLSRKGHVAKLWAGDLKGLYMFDCW